MKYVSRVSSDDIRIYNEETGITEYIRLEDVKTYDFTGIDGYDALTGKVKVSSKHKAFEAKIKLSMFSDFNSEVYNDYGTSKQIFEFKFENDEYSIEGMVYSNCLLVLLSRLKGSDDVDFTSTDITAEELVRFTNPSTSISEVITLYKFLKEV